jgi:type VI secretion system secreted protein VgrG
MVAESVSGTFSLTVTGDVAEVFKGGCSREVTQNLYVKGMGVVIEATTGITLKVGGNSVVIDSSGVTVKGTMVTIDGSMTKINSGPGSPPVSGQAVSPKSPKAPVKPHEADKADPVETAATKARDRQSKSGKYGSSTVEALAAGASSSSAGAAAGSPEPEEKKEKAWIEVQVLDAAGAAVRNEPVVIHFESGASKNGKTNSSGLVRLEGLDPDDPVSRIELSERKTHQAAHAGSDKQEPVPPTEVEEYYKTPEGGQDESPPPSTEDE